MVKDTHAKSEAAAIQRDVAMTQKMDENKQSMIDTLAALIRNNGNPPDNTVETGSRGGGDQK